MQEERKAAWNHEENPLRVTHCHSISFHADGQATGEHVTDMFLCILTQHHFQKSAAALSTSKAHDTRTSQAPNETSLRKQARAKVCTLSSARISKAISTFALCSRQMLQRDKQCTRPLRTQAIPSHTTKQSEAQGNTAQRRTIWAQGIASIARHSTAQRSAANGT